MKKFFYFIFLISLLLIFYVVRAGYVPPFGGEYTNLCGSGFNANFYNCPARCDINQGFCQAGEGQYIYKFICDFRTTNCDAPLIAEGGPGTIFYVQNPHPGNDKTVQLDVFRKRCLVNGVWTCTESDLLGYIVWWSGSSQSQIQCNTNEVQLSVSPNPSRINQEITFSVVAGDASTWWRNEFSGGVSDCSEVNYGWSTKCRATSVGTFTWTRVWRHCVGDINNCSSECRKSVSFTINAGAPTIITLPAVESL